MAADTPVNRRTIEKLAVPQQEARHRRRGRLGRHDRHRLDLHGFGSRPP
ncbi:hypothetical protein ACHMWU_27375 [Aeromicrobium sp. UC242_57]